MADVTLMCSLRSSSSTFSIACVSSAMRVNPMAADEPLRVCAARNSRWSRSGVASFSRSTSDSSSRANCSSASAMNTSMYALMSKLSLIAILRPERVSTTHDHAALATPVAGAYWAGGSAAAAGLPGPRA